MNGTGPPDRAQPLGLSTCRDGSEHRRRAQSSHAKVLKKNNRRAVCVATRARCHAPLLIHPRLDDVRTRNQGLWEVTYMGTGP